MIIVVHCDCQKERLETRHPETSEEDLERKINSQVSEEVRLKMADIVIDNSKELPVKQIKELVTLLLNF